MKFLIRSFSLAACILVACSGGGGGASTSTPTNTDATVSVLSNQTISGYPHTIDYYVPNNAESVIIFLHGGGGKKEGAAYDLGIKTDNTNSDYTLTADGQNWLINNKVAMVFPQGQTITGTTIAWTWNNYVMDSGQDDVAFLQALVANIKANTALPAFTKFYLAGHSNGGMMSNRMWCESPDTFDAFGALAGPASTFMASNGSHPCTPSTVKPYIGMFGDTDTVLETSGRLNLTPWTCSLYNGSSPSWVNATMINEKLFYPTRITKKCSGTAASPTVSGQVTTYSDCSGSLSLMIVAQTTVNGAPSGGDHCLLTLSGPCVTTLAGNTGLDYKTVLFNFFKQF